MRSASKIAKHLTAIVGETLELSELAIPMHGQVRCRESDDPFLQLWVSGHSLIDFDVVILQSGDGIL